MLFNNYKTKKINETIKFKKEEEDSVFCYISEYDKDTGQLKDVMKKRITSEHIESGIAKIDSEIKVLEERKLNYKDALNDFKQEEIVVL
jgi:lipopolysaccharide export LptBFGC system permease protein LptF